MVPLIITSPHVCPNLNVLDPSCDVNSLMYAKLIAKSIRSSILIRSRTKRSSCDNNRHMCRSTHMRRRLRSEMKKMTPNYVVLDVHSYPRGSFDFIRKPNVVLLDIYNSFLVKLLYRALKKHKVNVIILNGSLVNDIVVEAYELGGFGVLLEIQVHYSYQPK